MLHYSEVYREIIENRNISFDEKKSLLKNDNNDLFYQFVKFLYRNYNDTPENMRSTGLFRATIKAKVKYRNEAETREYAFPLPVTDANDSGSIIQWREKMTNDRIDQLEEAILKIAEYNIWNQRFTDNHELIPFERLEEVKHKTGKDEAYKDNGRSRKTQFCKNVLKFGIGSQLTEKGISRTRLLMLAYALKMTARETLALMQAVDVDSSINIWNGYEVILFYAIARTEKDITLADLDELGMFIAGKESDGSPVSSNDSITDTDMAWNWFSSLVTMSKEYSLREMKKMLRNIKAVNKTYSATRKEELDSMFGHVLKRSDEIFAGDYSKKCKPGDNADITVFQKCRNALTEQFWPYYGNQIQYLEWADGLKLMKYLPNRKHLRAVDEGTQPVTKADLEFVFFLRFALEHPLADYGKREIEGIDKMIEQRCSDYRLKVNQYMIKNHFKEVHDMDPFDGLLLVCMQKEFPIKTLHETAKEFFDIKAAIEIRNI